MESHITSLRRQVCLVTFQLSCVACVSARVLRESWDESTLQLSRNNSIGNACYTGYSQVFIPYSQIRSLYLALKTREFCVRCDSRTHAQRESMPRRLVQCSPCLYHVYRPLKKFELLTIRGSDVLILGDFNCDMINLCELPKDGRCLMDFI